MEREKIFRWLGKKRSWLECSFWAMVFSLASRGLSRLLFKPSYDVAMYDTNYRYRLGVLIAPVILGLIIGTVWFVVLKIANKKTN